MKNDIDILMNGPDMTVAELFRSRFEEYMKGVQRMSTLKAAMDLDLFHHSHSPISSDELSTELGTDNILTQILCRDLVEMGLLTESDGKFTNTECASAYLDSESPRFQEHGLQTIFSRMDNWTEFGYYLKNGPKQCTRNNIFGDRWIRSIGESCLDGTVGRVISEISASVDLSKVSTFLDLGGGHGLYTIGFMHRYPNIKGTIFDMLEMKTVAEEYLSRFDCDAKFIGGDFYKGDLKGPYDVVFISYNYAATDPVMCEKVFRAIACGGYLIVRRHLPFSSEDPFRDTEWNMSVWDGMSRGSKRCNGSWLPGAEDYLRSMKNLGMSVVCHNDHGNGTETIVMKKTVSERNEIQNGMCDACRTLIRL